MEGRDLYSLTWEEAYSCPEILRLKTSLAITRERIRLAMTPRLDPLSEAYGKGYFLGYL